MTNVQDIINDYNHNFTWRSLAKKYKIGYGKLSKIIDENNLEHRKLGPPIGQKRKNIKCKSNSFSDEDIKMIGYYYEIGVSKIKIAQKFNICILTLNKILSNIDN